MVILENIATDTQEDAVDIQDKSIDRLLDAAEKTSSNNIIINNIVINNINYN